MLENAENCHFGSNFMFKWKTNYQVILRKKKKKRYQTVAWKTFFKESFHIYMYAKLKAYKNKQWLNTGTK